MKNELVDLHANINIGRWPQQGAKGLNLSRPGQELGVGWQELPHPLKFGVTLFIWAQEGSEFGSKWHLQLKRHLQQM